MSEVKYVFLCKMGVLLMYVFARGGSHYVEDLLPTGLPSLVSALHQQFIPKCIFFLVALTAIQTEPDVLKVNNPIFRFVTYLPHKNFHNRLIFLSQILSRAEVNK